MRRRSQVLKDVLTYCLTEGQKSSEQLGYIPLPESVVEKVKTALENIIDSRPASGQPAAAIVALPSNIGIPFRYRCDGERSLRNARRLLEPATN